ncbi:MAG: hypothetical protein N4A46_13135 [Schleiferiaceae bacterium]|jgi:hypothetical protein|nr:hypothetical protein [Schleiferiaceae bacterium]
MKGLMARLLLPCEKASILVLKREEGKISGIEKVQLWMHTLICGLCKEFEDQNEFINVNMEKHYHNGSHSVELTKEEKEKMKNAILEQVK